MRTNSNFTEGTKMDRIRHQQTSAGGNDGGRAPGRRKEVRADGNPHLHQERGAPPANPEDGGSQYEGPSGAVTYISSKHTQRRKGK